MAEKHITPKNAARIVGVSERQLLHKLDTANVSVSSLSYDDSRKKFTASMKKSGQKKTMYIVENPRGKSVFFASQGALDHMRNNPDLYKDLRESATAVYIPTLTGRIDLL